MSLLSRRAACLLALAPSLLLAGCARTPVPGAHLLPDETPHLEELHQLTFGGENAEAYWSFDGTELSLQTRQENEGCDRIYRMTVRPQVGAPVRVSSGKGATTCAHFLPAFPGGAPSGTAAEEAATGSDEPPSTAPGVAAPPPPSSAVGARGGGGGKDIIYASTHLAGAACPPKPDMSRGYVWPLYDSYEIFMQPADGSAPLQLTSGKGYDAEGTVCGRDGSIVFTSTRDGDLELYRMDRDGQNVKRLTRSAGYDGGAFFNADCSRLVWRASRPRPGKELDDYRALLAQGLVRPSKLEIVVANADGSDPMQLTDLDAASFAPSFHPTEDVIIFSSNVGDPKGREFDLWAMRSDGSGLRRITHSPGFDGFPHFSPDGKLLAFSSNRATAPGKSDTNVFVARWKGFIPLDPAAERPADRIRRDVAWLADPAREGRGVGTAGLQRTGDYLEQRLRALGLQPGGDAGSFRQHFGVVTAVDVKPSTVVKLAGKAVDRPQYAVLGFSAAGQAAGPLVLAGYGIVAPEQGIDDYKGIDVKGKVVLVRRFAPEDERLDPALRRRLGDLRRKAWVARERGAAALLVVDWPLPPVPSPPDWQPSGEAPLLPPSPSGSGDAGLPVVMLKRVALTELMPRLMAQQPVTAEMDVGLTFGETQAFNVVGRLPAGKATSGGALIIGAHYDHLGAGGRFSLAPDRKEPHLGADDNASGTAAVLEVARALVERRKELKHDVIVAFFSAEESGLLGSAHYVRTKPEVVKNARAMLNLDMVGRLRDVHLDVLGADTAAEWASLVRAACGDLRLACNLTGDGQGPSDQASFYAAGLPVLHFFTGAHDDYHKPTDTAARINATGAATVAALSQRVLHALDAGVGLTYQKGKSAPPGGDARSFGASLGTIPDYGGPPGGKPGVLLAGVRNGGAADKAGIRRGDIIVRIGSHAVRSVEDLMYALQAFKPGETTEIRILREGKETPVTATFQEPRRGH
jgi:Tol biopolymer transport system component